jgi:purine-binding chemotaxis protein CheW
MSSSIFPCAPPELLEIDMSDNEFVTFRLAKQLLGIPVLAVHDVLKPQVITHTPLAPDWIAGVLNLRGRIVTAIDLRRRLGLTARTQDDGKGMSIVIEYRGEPYSLLIDRIGEVLTLDDNMFERNPVTLDPIWRQISAGIYRLNEELMVVLDVHQLLEIDLAVAA